MEPDEYSELIAGLALDPGTETVPAAAAIGRIAADDVRAGTAIPSFATSAMDGFALDGLALERARELSALTVSGDVPAGSAAVAIAEGTAVRVMTGAPVPDTAEVVVPVEDTDAPRTGPAPETLRVTSLPDGVGTGWNIRGVGEDTAVGDTVLRAGDRITAAGVGTLAMLGAESVSVAAQRSIGIIVTGDELHSGDSRLDLGDAGPYVRNSNLPMLSSAASALGASVVERSCGDDPAALLSILDELVGSVDLIITTGGISAGAFEVVRQALETEHSRFRRLALRPGGPQGHGSFRGVPLLHLPGTPTGAFLSFHLFAVSLLTGRVLRSRWRKAVFAGPSVSGHPRATSLIPGRYVSGGEVEGAQRSRLRDFASADVIVRVPRGSAGIRSGVVIAVLDC